MSFGCLEGVLMVSGRCFKGVWRESIGCLNGILVSQDRSSQDRSNQDRSSQDRSNQDRPSQDRSSPDMEIMVYLGILVTRKYFSSQKILTKITSILL